MPTCLSILSMPTVLAASPRPALATALRGGGGDHASEHALSQEASALFNNLRTPAALVASALLASAFALRPDVGDVPSLTALKRLYLLTAVASLCAELLAVVGATTAIQKLATRPPTAVYGGDSHSVTALLHAPAYEIYWVSCSVHFLLGTFGLAAMIGVRAWVSLRSTDRLLGQAIALTVTSSLLLMNSLFSDEAGGFCRTTWRGGQPAKLIDWAISIHGSLRASPSPLCASARSPL